MAMEGENGHIMLLICIVDWFVACTMCSGEEHIFQPFLAVKNEMRVGNFDVSKVYEICFYSSTITYYLQN